MSAALPSPASAPEIAGLADACVRCGLCLPHCPTYQLDRVESESPRGRIALARVLAQQTDDVAESLHTPLDHCLGCGRCEPVCPAKVRYGELLLATRTLQRNLPRTRRGRVLQRAVLGALLARPRRLSWLLGAYRAIHVALPKRLRLLPRPPPARPLRVAAAPEAPALFLGCIARSYEAASVIGLQRLLAASGEALALPSGQGCCGAYHAHAGDAAKAQALATSNRRALAGRAAVLSLASGCQPSLRRALPATTEVIDALAYLAQRRANLRFVATPGRVALHRPCTQTQSGLDGLRALLTQVPHLEVIELDAGFGCCGAAGAHMLEFPERAARLRQPLLEQIAAIRPDWVLSANIGCRLHLDAGAAAVLHPLEFLAARLDITSNPPSLRA